MLDHRLRRCPNIEPAKNECLVFGGMCEMTRLRCQLFFNIVLRMIYDVVRACGEVQEKGTVTLSHPLSARDPHHTLCRFLNRSDNKQNVKIHHQIIQQSFISL